MLLIKTITPSCHAWCFLDKDRLICLFDFDFDFDHDPNDDGGDVIGFGPLPDIFRLECIWIALVPFQIGSREKVGNPVSRKPV